jgi:hypothetical protein
MDTVLVVEVSVLAGGLAFAFYMDWLGLWVSKEEMKEEIARAKERMRQAEEQSGRKGPETGLVGPALEVSTPSCPVPPVHANEFAGMSAHAQAGNHPGRHTPDLERAQALDRWQDEGGQG